MDNTKKHGKPKPKDKAFDNAKKDEQIRACRQDFIDHLHAARKAKGLTQPEAAKLLGVNEETYKKYELLDGNRYDVPYYIKSLADLFDVSADYLIGKSKNPHPEYETVIKSTGLNARAISKLQELHALDGAEPSPGYLDFINCFLGNEDCTSLFLNALLPKLKTLAKARYGEYPSSRMVNVVSTEVADIIYDYVVKVVVPTYQQQLTTKNYTTADTEQYLTDDYINNKKKKRG